MMETVSLPQTPRVGGRSRFSKALPAPPPPLEGLPSIPSAGFRKQLPASPAAGLLPPLPQKDTMATITPIAASMSKPTMHSPLPPLPPAKNTPAPISIPRRPVGAPVSPSEPSPVASISSLLSAYSKRTSDSTMKSSINETASTVDSVLTGSPRHDGQPLSLKKQEFVPYHPSYSLDNSASRPGQDAHRQALTKDEGSLPPLPPPPPAKDSIRPKTPAKDSAALATNPSFAAASSPATGSPAQQQLWRRRSLKSERHVEVPELHLASSHGSTAASGQPVSSAVAPGTASLELPPQPQFLASPGPADAETAISRSPNTLPGRNIRPNASRSPLPSQQQNTAEMGTAASSLKAKLNRPEGGDAPTGAVGNRAARAKMLPSVSTAAPSPVARLPTPEYEKEEEAGAIVDMVVSPVSPASSPEPNFPMPPPAPKIARKALGEPQREVRPAKSAASLRPPRDLSNTAPRSPVGLPASPAANKFPARTTSRSGQSPAAQAPSLRELAAEERAASSGRRQFSESGPGYHIPSAFPPAGEGISDTSSTVSDATVTPARQHKLSVDTSDETLSVQKTRNSNNSISSINNNSLDNDAYNASLRDLQPSPAAEKALQLFPRNWSLEGAFDGKAAPGGGPRVYESHPVQARHHACYSRHARFVRSANRDYPLSCQACRARDADVRWSCGHCYLRVCTGCRDALRAAGGDLGRVMGDLERKRAQRDEYERHMVNSPVEEEEAAAVAGAAGA